MKKILLLILCGHVLSVTILNYSSIISLVSKKTDYNRYANRIIPYIKNEKLNPDILNTLAAVENMIGADRGYEFFSPNVASKEGVILFEDSYGNRLDLLDSIEGYIKYYTFNSYSREFLTNENKRNEIFTNISKLLFSKYSEISEINIYLLSKSINKETIQLKTKKILLTNVKKNK